MDINLQSGSEADDAVEDKLRLRVEDVENRGYPKESRLIGHGLSQSRVLVATQFQDQHFTTARRYAF